MRSQTVNHTGRDYNLHIFTHKAVTAWECSSGYISVSTAGLGLRSFPPPSTSASAASRPGGIAGELVIGRLHDVVWVMWLSWVRKDRKDSYQAFMITQIAFLTNVCLIPVLRGNGVMWVVTPLRSEVCLQERHNFDQLTAPMPKIICRWLNFYVSASTTSVLSIHRLMW